MARSVMVNIPLEIHQEIVHDLSGSMKTLKACSLVCRAWLPSTRNHLSLSYMKRRSFDFIELPQLGLSDAHATLLEDHIFRDGDEWDSRERDEPPLLSAVLQKPGSALKELRLGSHYEQIFLESIDISQNAMIQTLGLNATRTTDANAVSDETAVDFVPQFLSSIQSQDMRQVHLRYGIFDWYTMEGWWFLDWEEVDTALVSLRKRCPLMSVSFHFTFVPAAGYYNVSEDELSSLPEISDEVVSRLRSELLVRSIAAELPVHVACRLVQADDVKADGEAQGMWL
ncbi:uncharacterized protein B0H18DRAFT_1102602 [Fomitopsis serialis]|uniref:uncharacterized protein n=1 Tax=Fomitopsis serialis TaxID=139415 RepID=UPI002007333C|nr:uncharacterized protein B0H18DRAFT_1102602 [Neoantrodia serialis]KAH9931974.1 hypothetical protein B0H18DRAFT_1102602 [Neoantrodia serialis]